jgi:tetratricopeptide (TPR) repeat protein
VSEQALAKLTAWKLQAARDLLDEHREALGDTPEFITALGYQEACSGRLDEAVRLLTTAKDSKPEDPAPAFFLGETLRWQQQHDKARTAWSSARDRALALIGGDTEDARDHYYLGAARIRTEEFANARSALSTAGELGFDPGLISYQMGLAHTLEKNWEPAVAAFDELAELDPRFAYLYFYRGVAWGKRGRKDLMLNDMERFLALAPDAPEADVARTYIAAKGG